MCFCDGASRLQIDPESVAGNSSESFEELFRSAILISILKYQQQSIMVASLRYGGKVEIRTPVQIIAPRASLPIVECRQPLPC